MKEVVMADISSNESKDFTFSLTSGCEKIRLKHNGSSIDIIIGTINIIDIGLKENDTITVHISVSSSNPTVVDGIVIKELAIVKGDTFMGYKPYIPSVKMIADEVSAQNESLEEQGLINKAIWNDGAINTDTGSIVEGIANSIYSDPIACKNGDKISIDYDFTVTNVYVMYYNGSTYLSRDTFVAPTNATHFRVNIRSNSAISKSSARVYINNAIYELKNDLDKLNSLPKGTIIQIEADKDTINTTKEKYGWQYLGTSSIEYDNGSFVSMATNVYRKNN